MDINRAMDSIKDQTENEVLVVLQQQSPPEAQFAWRKRTSDISIDKALQPEAYEAIKKREIGGHETKIIERVIPKFVSKIVPETVRSHFRRRNGQVERVGRHTRKKSQPTIEEQVTPEEVETREFVFKTPFIEDSITEAITRVLNRNKYM